VERLSAVVAALLLAAAAARPPPSVQAKLDPTSVRPDRSRAAAESKDDPDADAAPPERLVVRRVELRLPAGEDATPLAAALPIHAGDLVTPRALRRAVLLLYGGGHFGDVVARALPLAPGEVVLVFECSPRRVVASVRVAGAAGALDEDRLVRAAGLAPDDELWPGRLEAAAERARAACARFGYRSAVVRARAAGERRAEVELTVEPGVPTRVAALDLGATPREAAAAVRTRAGAVLDEERLDADVRALRASLRREGWLRARVGAPAIAVEGDRARVAIAVDPGPRFTFEFAGNASVPAAALRDTLGLDAEPALDAAALEAAGERVRAAYRARGFAAARVAVAERAEPGRTAVHFDVEEGRRYRVRSVRFPGAAQRSEEWARERLQEALEALAAPDPGDAAADAERLARAVGSPAPRRAPPPAPPGEVWDPPLWDAAVARVLESYRAEGFLDAAHEGTRVALDARAGVADVDVRLREGEQTQVEAVTFDGNAAIPLADLAREARLAPGDALSYPALEATRTALVALYARGGWLYARVTDAEEFAPDRRSATVRFHVVEGPRVRVGAVVVSGAKRTREDVVRETLRLRAGDVYDPEAAARSQAALLRLGAFRSVGLRLSDPDVPEAAKDLTVEIAERPWRTLAPGIGFSLANGPRAFVELVQPNVFGRALELSARAKVNYPLGTFRPDLADKAPGDRIEGRGDVGLHDPRVHLFGTSVGARVDAIAERLHRPAYELTRASTIFGVDLPVAQRVTLSLQYELEVDHELKSAAAGLTLTRADLERLRLPEGVMTLGSVRPVLALDWRDDPVRPRRGWFASGTADYAHSIGSTGGHLFGLLQGSDVFTHMVKLSGTVTGYLPLGESSAFALSLRGGRVLPLDRNSQTIGPKRFFLGGAATMRGYGEEELIPEDVRNDAAAVVAGGQGVTSEGGEAFALAKAELRVPLRESVEVGIFTDVGNLWLNPKNAVLTNLRVSVGAGLRFATPIGPAVLDLGVNPAPDRRLGEGVLVPHFSIGVF
jgi:outer membrane protein insertion porin family